MNRTFARFGVLAIAALALALAQMQGPRDARAAASQIRYAIPGGAASGECTSWAAGCDLTRAIAAALPGDQVWVKQGTYTPGTTRTNSFALKNDVAIYGGFAGTETAADFAKRNPGTRVTILSGEIGDPETNGDNCYHVVVSSGVNSSAILDGFTITGGNANGPDTTTWSGGGMRNSSSSSPTLANLTFLNNTATYGGGLGNTDGSNPTLTNATFNGNSAASGRNGGGMWNVASSPTLNNVSFYGNSALTGGAIYNLSGNPVLNNVTMSGNSAAGAAGGGMTSDTDSHPTVSNSIAWGNTSTGGYPNIYNDAASSATILDSIVGEGCPSRSACTGVMDADPHLLALGAHGGWTATMPLGAGSAAIDAGAQNSTCTDADQRGILRPQDGDGDGTAACDLGATESRYWGTRSFKSAGAYDGWVLETGDHSGLGGSRNAGAVTLRLGDDASKRQYISILSFNTSSLPDGAAAFSAVLKIKKAGLAGANPFGALGSIEADIRLGTFDLKTLQSSDFGAEADHEEIAVFPGAPSSQRWYAQPLEVAVLDHINTGGLTQFRLHFSLNHDEDDLAEYLKFYSGNHPNPSYRPVLLVRYNLP